MTGLERDSGNKLPDSGIHSAARGWDSVDVLRWVEEPRYPYKRAIGSIVASVFTDYVDQGVPIYEVGAGTGFLKDLVPQEYHVDYTSTDYNLRHLQEGLRRRQMTIQEANANSLPVEDASLGAVINLDAYDTLPDLQGAMNEVARVLVPDGTFIHFQVNTPSDDTVMYDHPDYVFIPPGLGQRGIMRSMVGIKREDLIKGVSGIQDPVFKKIITNLLTDHINEYTLLMNGIQSEILLDIAHDLFDSIPGDRIIVPSLVEYFKDKMERAIMDAGLLVAESGYRTASLRLGRGENNDSRYNQFSFENGHTLDYTNGILKLSGSEEIIEKATMLVVVGKKVA